jgi:hypothetical protein
MSDNAGQRSVPHRLGRPDSCALSPSAAPPASWSAPWPLLAWSPNSVSFYQTGAGSQVSLSGDQATLTANLGYDQEAGTLVWSAPARGFCTMSVAAGYDLVVNNSQVSGGDTTGNYGYLSVSTGASNTAKFTNDTITEAFAGASDVNSFDFAYISTNNSLDITGTTLQLEYATIPDGGKSLPKCFHYNSLKTLTGSFSNTTVKYGNGGGTWSNVSNNPGPSWNTGDLAVTCR